MQANNNNKGKKTVVVASFDSGGVRALLESMTMKRFEQDVEFPPTKFIDLGVFCSGGIISGLSIIASKDSTNTSPLYSGTEGTSRFYNNCKFIFTQEKKGFLSRAFNKYAPAALKSIVGFSKMLLKIRKHNGVYSSDGQRKVIEEQFKGLKAKDTLVPFLIPTTDFQTGRPIWFTNLRGLENSHMMRGKQRLQGGYIYYVPEMSMADVILASIRPPILFDPQPTTIHYQEKDENSIYRDHSIDIIGTDGAFYAASPENYAYSLTQHWLESINRMGRDEYRIILLSIGSGRRLINNSVERIQELDPITQLKTIVDIATVLPYRAGQALLNTQMQANGDIYIRLDADIDVNDPKSPSPSLSDASPENLAKFHDFVENHFVGGKNKEEYDFAVRLLRRVAQGENIEDLVAERLGEEYWPLRQPEPEPELIQTADQGFMSRLFNFGRREPVANQNQHAGKRNPLFLRRSGSVRKPN